MFLVPYRVYLHGQEHTQTLEVRAHLAFNVYLAALVCKNMHFSILFLSAPLRLARHDHHRRAHQPQTEHRFTS